MVAYSSERRRMTSAGRSSVASPQTMGAFALLALVVSAAAFFWSGMDALARAWTLPEYSHGPLIPILSSFLFLHHLKTVPVETGPMDDRWPGFALIVAALFLGFLGNLARIDDVVAYALIGFVGGVILISFGWRRGWPFWPAVLHLVFMLPLPATLYWKVSTSLQLFSSEVGVWLIQLAGVPVFLEGNIIDLGVYKLHVAEACSGLRYLYPIMSFSYIFATLYRGPVWHKAVLLLSAAPITIIMNSIRIGIIGVAVDQWGLGHVEGLNHLLEGWVIFIVSIVILFALVKTMIVVSGNRRGLAESLDLEFAGMAPQLARIRLIRPSPALLAAVAITAAAALAWHASPSRAAQMLDRRPLALFPSELGDWRLESTQLLDRRIEETLGADDYLSASYAAPGAPADIDLFVAWYRDQTRGGIHSPEVCLPGGGWEMASIERVDIAPQLGLERPAPINRAVIQQGEARLLVYYWFEQYGARTASDLLAKAELLRSALVHGRSDGALMRLITPILPNEPPAAAERRLQDMLLPVLEVLPRYVPRAPDERDGSQNPA